jgi:hypothetical protein
MPGASAPKEGKTYKAPPTKRDKAAVAADAAAKAAAAAGFSAEGIGKAAAAAVDAVDAVTVGMSKIAIRKPQPKPELKLVDMHMQVVPVKKDFDTGKLPPNAIVVEEEDRLLVVFMSGKDLTPKQCAEIVRVNQERAMLSPCKPKNDDQLLAACKAIDTWRRATAFAEECGVDLLGKKDKIFALTVVHEKLEIPYVNDPTPKVEDGMCADGGGGRKGKAAAGGGGRKGKAAAGGGGAAVVAKDDVMDDTMDAKPGKRPTREVGK